MKHKCNDCTYFYKTKGFKTEQRYNGVGSLVRDIIDNNVIGIIIYAVLSAPWVILILVNEEDKAND